jgi:hypothetical protein
MAASRGIQEDGDAFTIQLFAEQMVITTAESDHNGRVYVWPSESADHITAAAILGIPYDPATDHDNGKAFYLGSVQTARSPASSDASSRTPPSRPSRAASSQKMARPGAAGADANDHRSLRINAVDLEH